MRRQLVLGCLVVLWNISYVQSLESQDLVITNARIVDGNGGVVERGNIVVRDGRIESIGAGATASGLMEVDADGLTAMPGFIDGHRHMMSGNDEQWFREESVDRMQEYLDAGFTTLMAGSGPVPGVVELQRRIEEGELVGPRIVTSGGISPESTPEEVEAQVKVLSEAGVEIIKVAIQGPEHKEILEVIVNEGREYDLEVMVHAVTVPGMIAAVEAGAAKLVHTPTRSLIEETNGARIVAEAGIPMTSTIAIWAPIYSDDNALLHHSGTPLPFEGVRRAGIGTINGRRLWDAGATYAFGTDTGFHPKDSLDHELKPLRLVFSPADIVKLMGPNTAAFIDKSDELGTLEPGKLADIAIIDGDPLTDSLNLLNVMIVVKGGEVVADHR